ncbi:MAG: hypothetical protein ACI9QD_000377 [Thermoproteota archaeon]|jgi:hypothetical protein
MKKTFKLTGMKHRPERQADQIKFEIKKYLTRERNKKVPETMDFWDFDCRTGDTENDAKKVHVNDISKTIDSYVEKESESFYMEILVRPGFKPKK